MQCIRQKERTKGVKDVIGRNALSNLGGVIRSSFSDDTSSGEPV